MISTNDVIFGKLDAENPDEDGNAVNSNFDNADFNINKVQLYTFSDKNIAVHPNSNTASVWLKTEDLAKIIKEHGNSMEFVDM